MNKDSQMVTIEIQNQFGQWQFHRTTQNMPTSIKQAFDLAARSAMAKSGGRIRAVDASGRVIDIR